MRVVIQELMNSLSKLPNAALKKKWESLVIYIFHLAFIRLESVDYKTIDVVYANSFSSYLGNEQLLINKLKGAFQRRAEQVEKIKESIERSPYKIVLSGDMNDTPTSFAYHELSDSLTDSFIEAGRGIGQTYIGKFPSFRIDDCGSTIVDIISYIPMFFAS